MTILSIIKKGDEILHKVAEPILNFDKDLQTLVVDMRQTLKYHNALGLAAPQVNHSIRLLLIRRSDDTILTMCNPLILKQNGYQKFLEGCLSIPDARFLKTRPLTVEVSYTNHKGISNVISLANRDAVVFFHELDHLNGILMDDENDS